MSDFSDISKLELRKHFKNIRENIPIATRIQATQKSINNLTSLIEKLDIKSIAIYHAINSELSLHDFKFENLKTALPIIDKNNQMQFCAWQIGEDLQQGRLGIMEPVKLNIMTPKAIIAPLLAVDAEGFRLGYGGGYYDKYFASTPDILKIGIGFEQQFCQKLPHESYDIKLDYFICERKILQF